MTPQRTIGAAFALDGVGLHTGLPCKVTLRPAPVSYGWRVVAPSEPRLACAMTWANRVPSIMSTSIALGAGRTIRTVEHMMASLLAFAIDNVLIEIDGPEIPIFDGSARRWCKGLAEVGSTTQDAGRRAIRVLKPVQVWQQGGFLRAEPAAAPSVDVTYDLLPDLPVMRWSGPVDRSTFTTQLAGSRSFGSLDWRGLLRRRPRPAKRPQGKAAVLPHAVDPALLSFGTGQAIDGAIEAEDRVRGSMPVLQGARFGRATLVVGGTILPYARFRDEPVRHVVLDMIGDLALAGAPLIGRIVAHNPSHEKTYRLVSALLRDRSAWTTDAAPETVLPAQRQAL